MNFKLPPILTLLLIASTSSQRPFYIIGHMINSIQLVKTFLDLGSNVLESDVEFNPNGTVRALYHGFPCDFLRICEDKEDLEDYLTYVRRITRPDVKDSYYGKMVMQFFDLKLKTSADKAKSGGEMARHILEYLWGDEEQGMKVLLYIEDSGNKDFIEGFVREFTRRGQQHRLRDIGFDGGMGHLEDIGEMFEQLNSTIGVDIGNIWQGDGITNFFRSLFNNRRLRQALTVRDSEDGYIKKVYDWTIDRKMSLRTSLRLDVDGIITNRPDELVEVLEELEFEGKFRMATIDDDPFERYEGNKDVKRMGILKRIENALLRLR